MLLEVVNKQSERRKLNKINLQCNRSVTNWDALVSFTRYNKYWSNRSENPESARVQVGTFKADE